VPVTTTPRPVWEEIKTSNRDKGLVWVDDAAGTEWATAIAKAPAKRWNGFDAQ